MGGSDQWGNIVTGTELIRRIEGGEAFALTCPLITKADGGKFGKTEEGNVWLDPVRTSPYKFYQFWLNVSDEDAEKYLKIFTMLGREEIEALAAAHADAPHARIMQKKLAEEVTVMVHTREEYEMAVEASGILFGKGTTESLSAIREDVFLSVFEGVPQFELSSAEIDADILDLLAVETDVFASKGEARRLITGGGVSINKNKVTDAGKRIRAEDFINNKYLLVQKGKKNYYLIRVKES
jgi:tyrosyl-tRNA synthetase